MYTSESLIETCNPEKTNWRGRVLSSTAVIMSAVAFAGCSDKSPNIIEEKQSRIDLLNVNQKTGRGDKTFKLKLQKLSELSGGPQELVVGINMDCEQSGVQSTSVSLEDAFDGLESFVCREPQYGEFRIPREDKLFNIKEVTVKVDASNNDLVWFVGTGIRDAPK